MALDSAYQRAYYAKNRERCLGYAAKYRATHSRSEANKKAWQALIENPERLARRYDVRVLACRDQKSQVFTLLGGACIKCGFSDVRALQLDHIDGGGNKDRLTAPRGNDRFRSMLRDPEGTQTKFQILCANCNWIKRVENKEAYMRNVYAN